MGVDMKKIMMYNILLLAGCASSEPVNCTTLACYKEEARKEILRDCMKNTKAYGYPMDSLEWHKVKHETGIAISPAPIFYCNKLARMRTK
jgi:hypothetical protein